MSVGADICVLGQFVFLIDHICVDENGLHWLDQGFCPRVVDNQERTSFSWSDVRYGMTNELPT